MNTCRPTILDYLWKQNISNFYMVYRIQARVQFISITISVIFQNEPLILDPNKYIICSA